LSLMLVAMNIIFMTTNIFTISEMVLGLEISFILFIIGILSYVVIYLLYQNRKQVLNRPVYLINETSGELDIE